MTLQMRLTTWLGDVQKGVMPEARDIRVELQEGGLSSIRFTMPGLFRLATEGDNGSVVPSEGRWIFQKLDVGVEFCWGDPTGTRGESEWVEPRNCRFQITSEKYDPDTKETTLTGRSVGADLTGGINVSGVNRNKETGGHDYKDVTPGFLVKSFLDSAKAAGMCRMLTFNFHQSADSKGAAWSKRVSQDLPFEATIMDALEAVEAETDWWTQGNVLNLVNAGSGYATLPHVCLVSGTDLVGEPTARSVDEAAQFIVARGDKGLTTIVGNGEWGSTRGPRAKVVTYSGVSTTAELQRRAQADLDAESVTMELQRDMNLQTATFLPFRDFAVGDVVNLAFGGSSKMLLQVASMTIVRDDDEEGLRVGLWFGDRVAATEARVARRVRALTGGAVFSAMQRTVAPIEVRQSKAAAPSDVKVVGGIDYDMGGYGVARCTVSWVPPTTTVEGDPIIFLINEYVVRARVGGAPWVTWGRTGSDSLQVNDLPPDTRYEVQVAAVTTREQGEWSQSLWFTTPADMVPPPAPTEPIVDSALGFYSVEWDGDLTGPTPRDFERVDVFARITRDGAFVREDRFSFASAGSRMIPANRGEQVDVRFCSVDKSGNATPLPDAGVVVTVQGALDNVDIKGVEEAAAQAAIDAEAAFGAAQGASAVMTGTSPTPPSTRRNGSPVQVGDLYYQLDTSTPPRVVTIKQRLSSGWETHLLTAGSILVPSSVGSTLIANGAVSSEKVLASSITADRLNVGSFKGFDIEGLVVTGGVLQTDRGSGARVVLDKVGLRAFNASNTETASITSTGGVFKGYTFEAGTVTGASIRTSDFGMRIELDDAWGLRAMNNGGRMLARLHGTGSQGLPELTFSFDQAGSPRSTVLNRTGLHSFRTDGIRTASLTMPENSSTALTLSLGSGAPHNGGLVMFENGATELIANQNGTLVLQGGQATWSAVQFNLPGSDVGKQSWRFYPVNTGTERVATLQAMGGGAGMPQTSVAANLFVDASGYFFRTSSASKFKLDQRPEDYGDLALRLTPKSWIDKGERDRDDFYDTRTPGLVAEDVRDVGLNDFVTYEADGEIQGVAYDRIHLTYIPVLQRHERELRELRELLNAKGA